MSDVHSKTTKDAAEALWTLLGKPEWKLRDIADVIQAAEERGRRRGVEEAAKLCDAEREAAWECSRMADARGDHRVGAADAHTAATAQRLAEAIRALAPRVPHASVGPPCAGCSHPKWQHQYGSKEHAFCCEPLDELQRDYCRCQNYLAPRDSGKDQP